MYPFRSTFLHFYFSWFENRFISRRSSVIIFYTIRNIPIYIYCGFFSHSLSFTIHVYSIRTNYSFRINWSEMTRFLFNSCRTVVIHFSYIHPRCFPIKVLILISIFRSKFRFTNDIFQNSKYPMILCCSYVFSIIICVPCRCIYA